MMEIRQVGPSLDLKVKQVQVLSLSLGDISEFYAEHSPFHHGLNRIDDLREYVVKTTGLLAQRRVDEVTAQHLLVTLGIFCYVDPIFALLLRNNDADGVFSKFVSKVSKKPYHLPESLNLIYSPGENPVIRKAYFDTHLLHGNVTEAGVFEQRDSFISEITRRRNAVYDQLFAARTYEILKHHELIGLHDVCMPLFAGRESVEAREKFQKLLSDLSATRGTFLQPFPAALAEYIPSTQ